MADILNAVSVAGSVKGGTGLQTIAGLGGDLLTYLKGVGSGNKTIGGDYNVDNSEYVGENEAGVGVYFDFQTGKYYNTTGEEVPVDFFLEG